MKLSLESLSQWLDRYFTAWKTNEPVEVAGLFTEDAVYYYGPFQEPARGRVRIVERWIADPQQQTDIRTTFEPLAVNGQMGIAHWQVAFRSAEQPLVETRLDGILVLIFDEQMRCREHREWYVRQDVRVPYPQA